LTFLRQVINNEGHFNLITIWENFEVIKNFTGQDFEKAKYYPEDNKFLLEFEEKFNITKSLQSKINKGKEVNCNQGANREREDNYEKINNIPD
jgi:heme-degrading monooxygenase HmoA